VRCPTLAIAREIGLPLQQARALEGTGRSHSRAHRVAALALLGLGSLPAGAENSTTGMT
jgi:hypothetical protein